MVVECGGLALNRLECFQLKELTAKCSDFTPGVDVQQAACCLRIPEEAAEAIETRHWSLGSSFSSTHESNLRNFKAHVEKLTIRSWYMEDEDEDVPEDEDAPEDKLKRLVNYTVKELRIVDDSGITGPLLKIFRGIESVHLSLWTGVVDLSDTQCKMIKTSSSARVRFQRTSRSSNQL